MNRGLLVDFGGVLTSPVVASFAAFCEAEGIAIEVFRRVVLDAARTEESPFARVETGAISQEVFDAEVASLLGAACGTPIDPTGLKQRLFAGVEPDDAMLEAVTAARAAGIRTALVSNSWGGADYPRERFDDLFDAAVISGDVGLRKPDPKIYLLAADLAGVPARECVFVDDFGVNVRGAEAVGMQGVLHRSAAETIPRLEGLLGVSLRAGPE